MSPHPPPRHPTGRWLIALAGYLAAAVVSSVITRPSHPGVLTPTNLLLVVLAGVVGILVTSGLSVRLALPTRSRVAVLFVVVFVLETLTNWVEAVLFISATSRLIPLTGAILAVGLAVPVGLLWPPTGTGAGTSVRAALGRTVHTRHWWSWVGRILALTLLWVPVYFAFAAADAPFVTRYYHESGTVFTVPATGVIALAEVIRGLVHAIVLGGLAALLGRSSRWRTWFWLTVTFAAYNAWLPLIQHADWPYYLRAANLVEITGDAIVYAGLVTLLLTARRRPSGPAAGVKVDPGQDVLHR